MWTIALPVWIQVSKKTKFYLNLNPFRNANFHTLNTAKVKFTEQVTPLLASVPKMDTVGLTFTLYTGNKQLCDISNICSIVDKFFTDALVSCGKIEDDNYKVVVSVSYRFGGIVKGEPRVDVLITPNPEITPVNQEETMQITINQNEIETAIREYIGNQITIKDTQEVDIDLKATRGETGFQAFIDIRAAGSPSKSVPAVEATKTQVVKPRPVVSEPVTSTAASEGVTTENNADLSATDSTAGALGTAGTSSEGDGLGVTANAAAETASPDAAEVAQPTEAVRKPSIFANLKKPVNAG